MNEISEITKKQFQDVITLCNKIISDEVLLGWIDEVSNEILTTLRDDGKIIFAGNGGSFADAQHISAEFVGRFMIERGSLSSICLGTNASSVTAIGNDYGFEHIFSREVSSIGKQNDLFIVISTSGKSENIISAIREAKNIGMKIYALLGKDGGQIMNMVPSFVVPSNNTARIQEIHTAVGHIICDIVDRELYE